MQIVVAALIVAGLLPLAIALWANRATSLAHAILWSVTAWLGWGIALVFGNPESLGMDAGRYCALCLTGCAGVAVLGARRPLVGAWNFVVVGLFAVMIWPLVEALVIGPQPFDGLRVFFMSATIAVGILNYLPTRLAPAAVFLLAACAGEIAVLYVPGWFRGEGEVMWLHALLLSAPWVAWLCLLQPMKEVPEFDRLWLGFRDRWGLLWSQRAREQFNLAAEHAGWPVKLMWRGLVIRPGEPLPGPDEQEKIVATLRAVLQRFLDPI